MNENMKDFLENFKNGSGYTWVGNNYMSLTKPELANIIKELLYSMEKHLDDTEEVFVEVAAELEEWL